MSSETPPSAKPSPTEILAALVAKRRANASAGKTGRGGVESERVAAARSAAKSKPALRK